MSTNSNNVKLSGNILSLTGKHLQQQQQQQQQQHIQQHPGHSIHQLQQLPQLPQHLQQQQQQQQQPNNGVQQQVPPRYQPPPLPPGGILKHLPPGNVKAYYHQQTEAGHLNIKYPPEVPKLANVYLPESIKNLGNPSRAVPPRGSLGGIGGVSGGGGVGIGGVGGVNGVLVGTGGGSGGGGGQQLRLSTGTGPSVPNTALHHRIEEDQQFGVRLGLSGQVLQQQEMLKFVRKSDTEPTQVPATGRLSAEQNRQLQSLVGELRGLKEANQRLSDDNQELRDLCCFLDDDRQKGRKLAREWQRFGRYTASVMRQEVSAYQNKLRQLDDKQQELIRDNLELKELCLYLDEERANAAALAAVCANCGATNASALRDDGDGSSSSTNEHADEPMPSIRNFERTVPELNIRPSLSDQTLQYVRSLERRIRQLEEERVAGTNPSPVPDPISGRPEAVVRALQVLEVREQLERDRVGNMETPPEHMDDGEKALVREMCNVVWRKLEDAPNGPGIDHM